VDDPRPTSSPEVQRLGTALLLQFPLIFTTIDSVPMSKRPILVPNT